MSIQASPDTNFATQTESAYWTLRDDIIRGRLKPSQKLALEGLRTNYGFGASPLREALNRLAADNLVTALGQRGYWVAPVSKAEFLDITDMRVFVEPEALSRSIRNATLDWESRVVAVFHRLSKIEADLDRNRVELAEAWENENRGFHMTLIENCGSPWLLRFASALFEQSRRYRLLAIERHAVPKEVLLDEHRAVFDAALARNAGLACALLTTHIQAAAQSLARAIFADGDTPAQADAKPPNSGTNRRR